MLQKVFGDTVYVNPDNTVLVQLEEQRLRKKLRHLCADDPGGIKSIVLGDCETCDLKSISDAFNNYFSSIFVSTTNNASATPNDQVLNSRPNPLFFDKVELTLEEVTAIIKKIPGKTSTDSDSLCYCVLKKWRYYPCLSPARSLRPFSQFRSYSYSLENCACFPHQ